MQKFYKNKNNLELRLNKIYKEIISGDCKGCGKCCSESVGASFVEAANIYVYLHENKLFTKELLEQIMKYYLDIYKVRNKCPFLDEYKRCILYDVRPLNCRLYGHWTKVDYESNLLRLKNEAIKTAENLKEEGYLIPKDYVDFQIPYCTDFIGEKYSLSQRAILYDQLIKIDSQFIIDNNLNIEYEDKGIVEHIAGFLFNTSKIDMLRKQNKISAKLKKRLVRLAGLIKLKKL